MARNEVFISAPPRAVFAVLADAERYGDWVLGTDEVRAADESWPAPGSAFAHAVGKAPLRLRDRTSVLDAEPPVMLRLLARARPLPSATVTFELQPESTGTRLTMTEAPSARLLSVLAGPLGHALLGLRNRESLRRLKRIVEVTSAGDRG